MNAPLFSADQATAPAALPSSGLLMDYKIPQPGSRPLVFKGTELAMAMSYTPGLPYWYELNLYHTDSQAFVAAIRLFYQAEEIEDRTKGWSFPTLDEALTHIQCYDAGADVAMQEMNFNELVPAEMAALALAMKSEVEAYRHHFSGLIGEFFLEIANADASIG